MQEKEYGMGSPNNDQLKKSTFGGMIWTLAERLCARLVSLVVSIILARILMPEDYSLVGIVMIFFTFCNVFISGGLNNALIQKKDADALDYSTGLFLNLSVAAVLYLVIYAAAPWIAGLYDKEILIVLFRVMGLTFFVNAIKSVLSAYISSNLQFKKFFFSTIVGTAISAVVGVVMALKGYGVWALVAQEMTNSIMDTLILLITARMKILLRFSMERIAQLLRYGWKILVSSMITVLYDQLNPLIVGFRFSAVDLAYYTKGNSFPSLINSTISDALASVLFPVMSKVQDDKASVLGITRRYVQVSSYVLFPVMIGFAAVADSFVELLLTEKWLPAVPYIRIFCISYMFNLIQVGNLQAMKAIGRSDVTLILEVIKKSIYFAIIFVFVFLSDSPEVLALSSIVCTVVASIVNTYPNQKLIGYSYGGLVSDLLPNLLISLVMGAGVLTVGAFGWPAYVRLPAQILAGVGVYVFLSIATRNKNYRYLLNYILKMLGRE